MIGRAGSLALWSLSQRLKMLGMFSGKRKKKQKKTSRGTKGVKTCPLDWGAPLRISKGNILPLPCTEREGQVRFSGFEKGLFSPGGQGGFGASHPPPVRGPGWLLPAPTAQHPLAPQEPPRTPRWRSLRGWQGLTRPVPLPLRLCHSRGQPGHSSVQHKGSIPLSVKGV